MNKKGGAFKERPRISVWEKVEVLINRCGHLLTQTNGGRV
jgi:hypothetical protein